MINYFLPEIGVFFSENNISPEYFSSPWILTAFANKIEDSFVIFKLWEELIKSNDPYQLLFLCLALLDINKHEILSKDISSCLIYIGSISIPDMITVNKIIEISGFFKNSMPQSMLYWLQAFNIFDLRNIDKKLEVLENYLYFQLLPDEVLRGLYPEILNAMPGWPVIPIVLIDCRLEKYQKAGYFSNSVLFSLESLYNGSKISDFSEKFNGLKGYCHFVIMSDKKIDSNNPVNLVIEAFLKNNFQFISVVKGGFTACHRFAEQYNLKIKKHSKELCNVCCNTKRTLKKISKYLRITKRKEESKTLEENLLCYKAWIDNI